MGLTLANSYVSTMYFDQFHSILSSLVLHLPPQVSQVLRERLCGRLTNGPFVTPSPTESVQCWVWKVHMRMTVSSIKGTKGKWPAVGSAGAACHARFLLMNHHRGAFCHWGQLLFFCRELRLAWDTVMGSKLPAGLLPAGRCHGIQMPWNLSWSLWVSGVWTNFLHSFALDSLREYYKIIL